MSDYRLIDCLGCHGTGFYGRGKLTCDMCEGAGKVEIPGIALICEACKGKGRTVNSIGWSSACKACGGLGWTIPTEHHVA